MPAVARQGSRATQKQQKQKENPKSLKRKRDQDDLQKLQHAVDEFVGRGVGGRERLDGLGRRQRGDSAYNDCHPNPTGRGSGLLRVSDGWGRWRQSLQGG